MHTHACTHAHAHVHAHTHTILLDDCVQNTDILSRLQNSYEVKLYKRSHRSDMVADASNVSSGELGGQKPAPMIEAAVSADMVRRGEGPSSQEARTGK